jgi:hypothetical protein
MTAATKIGTGNDELLCIIRDRDQDVIPQVRNALSDRRTRMNHVANATIGPLESWQEEPR